MIVSITKKQQHYLLKTFLSRYYHRLLEGSFLQQIYGVLKLIIKGNIYRLLIIQNPKYGLKDPSATIIRGNKIYRKSIVSVSEITKDFQDTIAESMYRSKNRQFTLCQEDRSHILSVMYEDIKLLNDMNAIGYDIEIYSGNRLDACRNMFHHTKLCKESVVFCISNFLRIASSKKCFRRSQYMLSSSEYAETVTSHISNMV
jgi:hypothetical protein